MEIDIGTILVTTEEVNYRLSSGKLIGYVGIDMFPAGTEVDARIPRGE